MVSGLQTGDALSVLQFHHFIVPGIEWLLRRRGALHPGRLARHLCHEMVLEIQARKLNSFEEIAVGLRRSIHLAGRIEPENSPPAPPDLGACNSRESEVAIRRFALQQSPAEICDAMCISMHEYKSLKVTAREIFRSSLTKNEAAGGNDALVHA